MIDLHDAPGGGDPRALGVHTRTRRGRAHRCGQRLLARVVAAFAAALTVALTLSGLLMTMTSPAHADLFGISDTVQEWICGMVRPDEPWESVGDGPESWLSNRNLGQFVPALPKTLSADGTINTYGPPTENPTAPEDMDQIRALPAGQYTLYEIAGLRGLSWWTIPLEADGTTPDCSIWNYLWTEAGNLIFTINKTALQIVISLKEAASSDNPLGFLYDASSGALSSIFTLFFVPIACLMLIGTGIWTGVNAMRNKGTRTAIGAVGAALGITALVGFLYLAGSSAASGENGFRQVAGIADQGIASINGAATNALFDTFTSGSGTACALDTALDPVSRGQRVTSCVLADALAYRPWSIGQFGGRGANPIALPDGWNVVMPGADGKIGSAALAGKAIPCYVQSGDCRELRTYLIAQHGGIQIGGALDGQQGYVACSLTVDAAESDETVLGSAYCSPMYQAFTALVDSDPATARAYSGGVGIARVSQAISSLIGTAVAGTAVAITSIISMGWHAFTFVLYLIGAIKLAFATYAGKTRMAKEWFGDLVYAWVARLAYGIVLSLTILIVVWMLSSAISFGMRLVWLGVILFLFWKLMQKVQVTLKPSFASNDAPDMMGGLQRAGTIGRNTTRGAAERTAAGVNGAAQARRQHQINAQDPTRGRLRRTVSATTLPLRMVTGGARGAATGNAGVQRRALTQLSKASMRQQGAPAPVEVPVPVSEIAEEQSPALELQVRHGGPSVPNAEGSRRCRTPAGCGWARAASRA